MKTDADIKRFSDAVLDALDYNGGESPEYLLRLMCERLSPGKARKLIELLGNKKRADDEWRGIMWHDMVEALNVGDNPPSYSDRVKAVAKKVHKHESTVFKAIQDHNRAPGPDTDAPADEMEHKYL